MAPRVLTAILHWNSPQQALRCVESVRRATDVPLELVVVDNSSTEANYARLVAALPHVTVLRSPANKGYAGGMNLALGLLEKVSAQYVLLLTQDVIVAPRMIGALVDTMTSQRDVGIVGPLVYSLRRTGRLLSAGGYVDIRRVEVGHLQNVMSRMPYDVDWVDGCCMLLSARLLETVGGFDERYFMYYEENDLCQRARRAGWRVMVSPKAIAWHEESMVPRPAHYRYMARNAYLYWNANFGVGFWPVAFRLMTWVGRYYAAAVGSVLLRRVRSNAGLRVRLARAGRATAGALLGSLDYLRHRETLSARQPGSVTATSGEGSDGASPAVHRSGHFK